MSLSSGEVDDLYYFPMGLTYLNEFWRNMVDFDEPYRFHLHARERNRVVSMQNLYG